MSARSLWGHEAERFPQGAAAATLHAPARRADESMQQYRTRQAQSKAHIRAMTTGRDSRGRPIWTEQRSSPKVRRTGVSHRQSKRARMEPLRAAKRVAAAALLTERSALIAPKESA